MVCTSGLANSFLYLHLAATKLGLASQWISAIAVPFVGCMVKDLLGIPQVMETYDMMVLESIVLILELVFKGGNILCFGFSMACLWVPV